LFYHREILPVVRPTWPGPRQPKSLTTPTPPPGWAVAGDTEGMSEAEPQTTSVRELKEELKAAGVSTAGMLEKADLIAAVASLRDAMPGTSPAYARGLAQAAAGAPAQPVPSQPAPAPPAAAVAPPSASQPSAMSALVPGGEACGCCVLPSNRTRCAKCGKVDDPKNLKKCKGCSEAGRTTSYCGAQCQKAAWKAHKPVETPTPKP